MKIALTGHTKGIGLAIQKKFKTQGWQVSGFSRSNGWDLTDDVIREKFYEEIMSNDFDVFINNAYPYSRLNSFYGFLQVELLNKVWSLWHGKTNKIILTIGSTSAETTKNYHHPYSVHKKAIDDTCKQLRNCADYPQVINIKPGLVDTDVVKKFTAKKSESTDVADVVWYAITSPVRIYDIHFGPK